MGRPLFTLLVIAVVIVVLAAMWIGWRARTRRDASVKTSATAPSGELLASFADVFYVSTTPQDEPLVRVAVTGLRYRGRADVTVRSDGVTIEVRGEEPVYLATSQILGSGSAGRRVGKAVESDGLALLRWAPQSLPEDSQRDSPEATTHESPNAPSPAPATALESSFRFDTKTDQRAFIQAIETIAPTPTASKEHKA